jgi:hypothetical protein
MKHASVCFVVVVFAVCLAHADAPRVGVVTGTVFDPGGAPMPGATVQLTSDRGTESTVSDAEGGFRFAFVIPDTYTVRADLTGFQSAEGMIVVSAGGRADVVLRLSEVAADEIVVTGETPLINKFDVTGGGTVDAKEIETIVAPQRWYHSLLEYLPGTTISDQSQELYDVEGNTGWRNNYYIDGVDASFARLGGGSTLRLPNVAVGQVQMYSTRADAEWSRSMGALTTVVVKSGTNDFHGDLSATFQNLAWNEEYDAFPQELPDDLDIRYEVAIGGPIKRDKLWFFVSAADMGILGYRVLAGGDRVATDIELEPRVAKLDYRPSPAHSLALTATETLSYFPYYVPYFGDRYTGIGFVQGGEFATLRWSWAISDDLFLDTAASTQKTYDDRDAWFEHENDPSAPPWSPAGNNDVLYYDAITGLMWNTAAASRMGTVQFPRTQGNVSLNWFTGDHDVKLGLDYQDTRWRTDTWTAPFVIGLYYDPNLPGGFVVPYFLREYVNPADVGGVENKSEVRALFVRDRFTVGDHWTFNLGLRLDDQTHMNDVGTEIIQSTDLAPRLTAVYDVRGDSKLLVTAGVGRYYDWIPMELTQNFNEIPQGRAEYDQYLWIAAVQDFAYHQGHFAAASNIASNTTEPAHKDEFTLGVEWALHPNWAFKANALYYEAVDQYSQEEQVLEDGTTGFVFENIPDARQERTSVSFVVRRRFLDNWTMTASYTWSRTEGNCYNVWNTWCGHRFGKLRDVTNDDGVPLSVVNRDGYPTNHVPHVFKIRGSYLFPLGKGHTVNVGGFAQYQSGRRWQLITEHVDVLGTSDVFEYLEPAGNRELDAQTQIDLNASWQFPIAGGVQGSFTLEVINVTNEQALVFVSGEAMTSGDEEAGLTTFSFQPPRGVRALATLRF